MSVAWTTILVIALLFPGVFFFIGLSSRDRFSREVIRSNVIGDVGLAIWVALVLHFFAFLILSFLGLDIAGIIGTLSSFEKRLDPAPVVKLMIFGVLYTIVMAGVGWLLGWLAAASPFFARHKWISTVNRSMKEGLVTAYVMTTTVQNGRALMYKGVLAEFYLTVDGSLTYIVLKNCSRYLMKIEGDEAKTTAQLKLFGNAQDTRESWDYLFIDAKNIANILFDPSPEIKTSDKGNEALENALAELRAAMDAAAANAKFKVRPPDF
jgi:hypothetical protein